MQIQLRKLPSVIATLVVHGEPTGRVVAIDGEPRCEVPCRVEVDPGHHLVQVGELQRALRVDPGAVLEIEVNDVTRPVSPLVVDGPAASTPNRRTQPGSLTWIGTGVLAAGAIGALAFGLRTAQLHDRYEADPTRATRNRGVVMRSMLYTSIGVAALGSALLVIDLAIVGPRRARLPRRLGLTAHGWSVRF